MKVFWTLLLAPTLALADVAPPPSLCEGKPQGAPCGDLSYLPGRCEAHMCSPFFQVRGPRPKRGSMRELLAALGEPSDGGDDDLPPEPEEDAGPARVVDLDHPAGPESSWRPCVVCVPHMQGLDAGWTYADGGWSVPVPIQVPAGTPAWFLAGLAVAMVGAGAWLRR
jgi:hypothetical protein